MILAFVRFFFFFLLTLRRERSCCNKFNKKSLQNNGRKNDKENAA